MKIKRKAVLSLVLFSFVYPLFCQGEKVEHTVLYQDKIDNPIEFEVLTTSCSNADNFIINGNVSNADGKTIFLCKGHILEIETKTEIVDSTTINNGQFLFKGSIASF